MSERRSVLPPSLVTSTILSRISSGQELRFAVKIICSGPVRAARASLDSSLLSKKHTFLMASFTFAGSMTIKSSVELLTSLPLSLRVILIWYSPAARGVMSVQMPNCVRLVLPVCSSGFCVWVEMTLPLESSRLTSTLAFSRRLLLRSVSWKLTSLCGATTCSSSLTSTRLGVVISEMNFSRFLLLRFSSQRPSRFVP